MKLHVYIEQFLRQITYFTQGAPETIYLKNTTAPPPPVLGIEWWSTNVVVLFIILICA